ncbi:MAG: class I SAM-dependent methyltransferase [Phycisphaeraceae bacterium]
MALSTVPITCSGPALEPHARAIADQFHLSLAIPAPDPSHDPLLMLTPDGLQLRAGATCITCDFLTGPLAHRIRLNTHNRFRAESLIKAMSPPKTGDATKELGRDAPLGWVIDATAGLGRDSMLLALAGFHVIAIEQNPVVAALFHDGLSRALADPAFSARLGDRLTLRLGDAVELIPALPPVDGIYLDPMFPPRSKSALVKKEMQLLQLLHNPRNPRKDDPRKGDARKGDPRKGNADDERLLDAALAHVACRGQFRGRGRGEFRGRGRVVVKRPRLAPPLAGRKPAFTRMDKTVRYDVYLPT